MLLEALMRKYKFVKTLCRRKGKNMSSFPLILSDLLKEFFYYGQKQHTFKTLGWRHYETNQKYV